MQEFTTATSRPRILVVDDDKLLRELLEAYLLDADYEVVSASNGKAALDAVDEHHPDLVLLDVQMPVMDGYEVCRLLKTDVNTQFIPVVMVTALEGDEDKIKAIEAGADDFLTKPYNSYMLLTRVKSLLRIKRLHDELDQRTVLVRRVLNRYVDEDIADVILADPDRYLKLGGESRPVTVLFADIRGFTQFSERHDAQEVVNTLNKIFTRLTDVILKHHGTLDKYIGDEVMAFFGAPVPHSNDTFNAILAARELQAAFPQVIAELDGASRDASDLGMGVGLSTGNAAVGNVGSEHLMNYTVIGDVVNTAHRLVEIAASGQVLFGHTTYQEVMGFVRAEEIEPRVLPGKDEPTTIYRLLEITYNF